MKISLILPSRGRPVRCYTTVVSWLSNFVEGNLHGEIEFIVSLDTDEPEHREYYEIAQSRNVKIIRNPNKNAVEAINRAAKECNGDLIIVISDDFECPQNWNFWLLKEIGNRIDFCAKTIDGHQDWLITLPIMDRVYYERLGYVYHPSYTHIYADLEMTCVAWMLNRYVNLSIEFKHLHPVVTHQPLDAINIRNNKSWGQGKRNFRERMKINFGINPVKELPANALHKQGL